MRGIARPALYHFPLNSKLGGDALNQVTMFANLASPLVSDDQDWQGQRVWADAANCLTESAFVTCVASAGPCMMK